MSLVALLGLDTFHLTKGGILYKNAYPIEHSNIVFLLSEDDEKSMIFFFPHLKSGGSPNVEITTLSDLWDGILSNMKNYVSVDFMLSPTLYLFFCPKKGGVT